jgi:ribosomal protein S18 acetylase RimI-like enzyme
MEIIKVKRFSERSFEAVSRLLPQLSSDADLLTREYLIKILATDDTQLFFARIDKKHIVGMLTIAAYKTPSGIKVWIEDVVVDESHRGNGIGKAMMLFAIDYSRSLGARYLNLTSRPSRIAANELYSKLGFKKYETNFYKYLLDD